MRNNFLSPVGVTLAYGEGQLTFPPPDPPLPITQPGVSISTNSRQNTSATLLRSLLIPPLPQNEAISLNNVMDKKEFAHKKMYMGHNLVIIICSLPVGVNCVANKSKFDFNPNLLMEKLLFHTQFNPTNTGKRCIRALRF